MAKTNWNSINLTPASDSPTISLDNGDELVFADFDDYRSFVMTLVGMIGSNKKLPFDIVLQPKNREE